jgi:poly(A)-specific ribonuclease
MTNSLFPRLLDTKHMASTTPLKDLISNTALGDMEKILSKDPFPTIRIQCAEYDVQNQKLHEAGYDAFLTGYCYLKMLHYLESFNSSPGALVDFYLNK